MNICITEQHSQRDRDNQLQEERKNYDQQKHWEQILIKNQCRYEYFKKNIRAKHQKNN